MLQIEKILTEKLSSDIQVGPKNKHEIMIYVSNEKFINAISEISQNNFKILLNITAIDLKENFKFVYNFLNLEENFRLNLISFSDYENPKIDSITKFYPNANWFEREIFDLFGINFKNHPNLKRLLLLEDWQGHPLRKDYQDESIITL